MPGARFSGGAVIPDLETKNAFVDMYILSDIHKYTYIVIIAYMLKLDNCQAVGRSGCSSGSLRGASKEATTFIWQHLGPVRKCTRLSGASSLNRNASKSAPSCLVNVR